MAVPPTPPPTERVSAPRGGLRLPGGVALRRARKGNPPYDWGMCRSIKTLFNFEPPATDEEIRASSLQFVRKLSGFARPSKTNQLAFSRAVEQVEQAARQLLNSLVTDAPPRDREAEAAKARARAANRFGASDRRPRA